MKFNVESLFQFNIDDEEGGVNAEVGTSMGVGMFLHLMHTGTCIHAGAPGYLPHVSPNAYHTYHHMVFRLFKCLAIISPDFLIVRLHHGYGG